MTITARNDGYKDVTRKVPLRSSGVLRVDFTMEPGEGASVETSTYSVSGGPLSTDTLFSHRRAARGRPIWSGGA